MRVKVGDRWFEPSPGEPIMVEMNSAAKALIRNMRPQDYRLAYFHADDPMTVEEREAWMERGAEL